MNTTIQIRVDSKIKKGAQKTFEALGLDMSSGVKMFLAHVNETKSIPFTPITTEGLKLRYWKTYQKEATEMEKNLKDYKRYSSAEEAFDDILGK